MFKDILTSDIEEIVHNLQDQLPAMSGKTLLLTGAAGFLGRYFMAVVQYLNKSKLIEPIHLLPVDSFIASSRDDLSQYGFDVLKLDICNEQPISQKIDFIIHAAGIASPHYYRKYPLETLDVAIQGTRQMLELAKKHNAKLLFFSSSEIYGNPDPRYIPTSESYRGNVSSIGPRACYDESKRLGETLCHIYSTEFATEAKIVRPFNVYGPGMKENDYRVLPNFANRIAAQKAIKIYSSGQQTRTFCYITDAINGFFRVLISGEKGQAYNIGNPTPEVSMIELAEHVRAVVKNKFAIEFVSYPKSYPSDEPQRRCPDISKAQGKLSYQPKVELPEGLKRFFTWAEMRYLGIGLDS